MTEEKKSMVPKLRFPGFNETWEQRKFQGITQRVSTSSISSIDFPSVEYEDIEAGSGILNKDVKLKEKNKKGIVFDKNDILFGKLRPYLMNWLLADFKGVAVGDFWVLRSQNFDPKFVCSLIQSKSFQEVANRSSGSKMPRADWNLVSNTLFFVPPQNNEQRKIGELFSSLDKVITLHQRKLEGLSKLKKSLLQKMFPKNGQQNPEVRFPGFTEAWEQRKLEELASKFTGGGTPNTSNPNYWNGEIPWIQSSDLKEDDVLSLTVKKHISQEGLKNSATKIVPKNSLVIVTRVGVGKLVVNTQEIATSQDFLSLSGIKGDSRFLAYSLYSLLKKITRRVQGTSIKGITKTDFLKETILVPALEEQEKISSCMVEVDKLITLHQRKLESLKKLKKSLLQQMFV